MTTDSGSEREIQLFSLIVVSMFIGMGIGVLQKSQYPAIAAPPSVVIPSITVPSPSAVPSVVIPSITVPSPSAVPSVVIPSITVPSPSAVPSIGG